ncbi:MAG TPA: sulfatase [Thermoanaerobaculia bacterium]|jgi:arylsulfatase A-like enzyme|nr:sulfatase [Thermoanaerobaculia bacterium]
MTITRRTALKSLAIATLAGRRLLGQTRPVPRDVPNILFIMTDDQRKDALSIYGNPVLKTPNIDRIGSEGMRIDEFFVTNSLCAPSRATFYTGVYSHVHGITTNGAGEPFRNQGGFHEGQQTFITLLHDAGYETALVGKWHIRSTPNGFDSWTILPGGGGPYLDPPMTANGVHVRMRGHADDVVGDQTIEYLQNRAKDRPFLLLMNFKSPHRNWIPAKRFENAFEGVDIPLPRTYEDRLDSDALKRAQMAIADMPDFKDRGVSPTLPREERKRRNYEALVKNYYRTMLSVDENVGRALEFLDKNDLTKNTLVVFTSDNGAFLGEFGLFDKRLMYDAALRVPLLLRWPAHINPGSSDNAHLLTNVDIAPTLLEIAGVPIPASMQGQSFMRTLQGQPEPSRDAFYYEFFEYPDYDHCARKHRGLRTAKWKLIEYWEKPIEYELYDLEHDPDETKNLAASKSSMVRELKSRMDQLRHDLGEIDAPGPVPAVGPCTPRTL